MTRILKGVAALLLLTAVIIGVPVLLISIGAVPHHAPSLSQVRTALSAQDDGRILYLVLAVGVWTCWALFTATTAVEAIAAVRGGVARSIRGLAVFQHPVTGLVSSIAILFTAAPAAFGPAMPAAHATVAAQIPGETSTSVMAPASAAVPTRPVPARPTYLVQRHDTLWAIAERHLGNPLRYHEITALNRDLIHGSEDHLQPGWRLAMPADATGLTPPPTQQPELVVEPGDTLTSIAADHQLLDWHPLYEANAVRAEPDGAHLTDPNLIRPGWTLALPRQPTESARHAPRAPAVPPTRSTTSPPSAHSMRPDEKLTTDPYAAPSEATARAESDDVKPIAEWGLGLAGLTAAGVVAAVARRRVIQQRHRATGHRISMPPKGVASRERDLRLADNTTALRLLDTAGRLLVQQCTQHRLVTAPLAIARVLPDQVEFLFTEPTPAIEPFGQLDDHTWCLHRNDAPDTQLHDCLFPFPTLVTLGRDDAGIVLANLETAGTLTIVGSPDDASAFLSTAVLELGTSPLTDQTTIHLAGVGHEAAGALDPLRLELTDDPDRALKQLRSIADQKADALRACGVRDLQEARLRGELSELWPADVLVLPAIPELDIRTPDAIGIEAGAGTAILNTATTSDPTGTGWKLYTGADRWRLEPFGITIRPQRPNPDQITALVEILSIAQPGVVVEDAVEDEQATAIEPVTADQHAARESAPAGAPMIRLLGTLDIVGARGSNPDSNRRRRITELAAYLVLHPNADRHQIEDAIWPGDRVSVATRNATMSRLRSWLGSNSAGEPYVPPVAGHDGYRLAPEVSSDWHEFLRLSNRGYAAAQHGLPDLEEALALVRGRPFAGINPATYTWAEGDIQDMISAITDVAHTTATLLLDAGEPSRARTAAGRGLLAEPCSERLFRDALTAAHRRGDTDDTADLIQRLRRIERDLEPDDQLEDATLDLIHAVNHDR
jgi:LysM repeat protein/DNA-binding SARP family transcriptional activator